MRLAVLTYSLIAYIIGVASIVYTIPWLAGIDCPESIDTVTTASFAEALVIDTALMFIFALQHTVQARLFFKKFFNRFAHHSIERASYVLLSGLGFGLMFWQWRGVEGSWVWRVEHPVGASALWALCALGWVLALMAIAMKNHFHFMGLRQGWLFFRDKLVTPEPLKTSILYSLVRHPMYFGFLLAFWATPTMSMGHFFFAALMTIYTLVGIQFEERKIISFIGSKYEQYQERVPMLIPFLRLPTTRSVHKPSPHQS